MSGEPDHTFLTVLDVTSSGFSAKPGQFFMATLPTYDRYFPQKAFPFQLSGERVKSLLTTQEMAEWAGPHPIDWRGPFGRGFQLSERGSRVVVVSEDGFAAAHLVSAAEALIALGCEVAFICGRKPLPDHWLPAQVEYQIVPDAVSGASGLWRWADQAFGCGSGDFFARLKVSARESRLTEGRGWAQILIHDRVFPCGTGLCYFCAQRMNAQFARICKDGPVFDLADWPITD